MKAYQGCEGCFASSAGAQEKKVAGRRRRCSTVEDDVQEYRHTESDEDRNGYGKRAAIEQFGGDARHRVPTGLTRHGGLMGEVEFHSGVEGEKEHGTVR